MDKGTNQAKDSEKVGNESGSEAEGPKLMVE